jgi:hypothetical protein
MPSLRLHARHTLTSSDRLAMNAGSCALGKRVDERAAPDSAGGCSRGRADRDGGCRSPCLRSVLLSEGRNGRGNNRGHPANASVPTTRTHSVDPTAMPVPDLTAVPNPHSAKHLRLHRSARHKPGLNGRECRHGHTIRTGPAHGRFTQAGAPLDHPSNCWIAVSSGPVGGPC